jgi:hypothetical protein
MNQSPDGPGTDSTSSMDSASLMEAFLSGAYRRILWTACVLSVAGVVAATLLADWRSGLGLAIGALVACLNFVWLHHGAEMAVQRMMSTAKNAPSKFRLALAFTARYVLVLAASYVILKGYPQVRVAFIVGLACPVIAAMGEGLYEAARPRQTSNT